MDQVTARKVSSPKVPLSVESLSFGSVPGQSRLFLDYLDDPSALKEYYPNVPRKLSDLNEFAPQVLDRYATNRDALCKALVSINKAADAGPRTFENIDRLRNASCVAIVTGQQAGLFTGPLYTIYKALSAIKLAERLTAEGTMAVPVFWAATEDHDLEEVSTAWFLDRQARDASVSLDNENEGLPVGAVELSAGIHDAIEDLFSSLPETDFSAQTRDLLTAAWSPGTTIGSAFLQTTAAIFSDYGLIVLDPRDEGIKALCTPIYADAVRRADDIVEAVVARSGDLAAAGYDPQVVVEKDHFPLFWLDDAGHRLALRTIGEDLYRAKGTKTELTKEELLSLATEHPESLSPGVMLRPVVQDYLLPTLCYFGGAAEIAYFAQNSEVYRILDRPVTPIVHRQSFTIIEKKHRKVLDRFRLDLEDLFAGEPAIIERLAAERISKDTADLFAEVETHLNSELDRLDRQIAEIDPTVADNLAKRRRKILYHVAALKKKTLLASVRRDNDTQRQIESLFAALLPSGGLQERTLNYFSFANKLGPRFIDWLYDAVDLEDKGHRIIDLQ